MIISELGFKVNKYKKVKKLQGC